MKRLRIAALLLLAVAGLTVPAFADTDDSEKSGYGPGGKMGHGTMHGPGMGCGAGMGHGPGMMSGGEMGLFGMGRMGHMGAMLEKLSPEQRAQVKKVHLEAARKMIDKRADIQKRRLDLAEAMGKFPLDRQAALERQQGVNQARAEAFAVMLEAMAQVQQIVGKELWEEMHLMAPGSGHHERHHRWERHGEDVDEDDDRRSGGPPMGPPALRPGPKPQN